MSQILQFPSQRVQGLAFLEQQLRQLLLKRGADEELMDFASRSVREIYQRNVGAENYSLELHFPAGVGEAEAVQLCETIRSGVETIRNDNHKIVIHLIAELVLAEVKIFQQQRGQLN